MNTNEYLTALENFINKMQQLNSATPVQISEAMAELCCVLKIGKVELFAYENEASEHFDMPDTQCFYDCGNSSNSEYISKRIVTVDENIGVYKIYIRNDVPQWTDEERSKIDTFISLFSTFSGKFRLLKLTQHMTFFDSELNMHNLRYFMKCGKRLCKSYYG